MTLLPMPVAPGARIGVDTAPPAASGPALVRLDRALGQPHIPGLDALRGVAILLVMAGHASEGWSDSLWTRLVSSGGSLGVEGFFVLSGFLITWLLLGEWHAQGTIDLGRFYKRRAARLFPAFYAYLILGLVISVLRHVPIPWGAVASSVFYVINYYQAATGAPTHFLSHCWSLAVEEQFYLLWPALFMVLLRRGRALGTALLITVAVIWIYRWILVFGTSAPESYLYRALETRGDHLAIGCLVAVWLRVANWRKLLDTGLGHQGIWLLLALSICAVSLGDHAPAYKFGVGFMVEPVLIGLFLVSTLIASQRSDASAWLVNNSWLAHIGRVSYCMYLVHGLVMFYTFRLVINATGSEVLAWLAAAGATIAFATLSLYAFEAPMRRWINARW